LESFPVRRQIRERTGDDGRALRAPARAQAGRTLARMASGRVTVVATVGADFFCPGPVGLGAGAVHPLC